MNAQSARLIRAKDRCVRAALATTTSAARSREAVFKRAQRELKAAQRNFARVAREVTQP